MMTIETIHDLCVMLLGLFLAVILAILIVLILIFGVKLIVFILKRFTYKAFKDWFE